MWLQCSDCCSKLQHLTIERDVSTYKITIYIYCVYHIFITCTCNQYDYRPFDLRAAPIFTLGSPFEQLWKRIISLSFVQWLVKIGLFDLWPPAHANFWPQVHYFNKSEQASSNVHRCMIWKSLAKWLIRRGCLKSIII